MMNIAKRIAKHNRSQQESMASRLELASEALAYFERTGRWPGRRYRVVSNGMTSRLMGRKAARRAQMKYGGAIELAVPCRRDALKLFETQDTETPQAA